MAVGSGLNVTVDARELDMLAEGITRFPKDVIPKIREQIETSAINVRDDSKTNLKRQIRGRKSRIKHLPGGIQYKMERTAQSVSIEATIAPETGRQKSLGAIIEGGSVNNAPIPFLEPALRSEEPWLVRGMMQALEHEWGRA